MKTKILVMAVCIVAMANFASADTIQGINIDFVSIGAGTDSDPLERSDGTSGYGAVDHNYRIGKYEITNAQWTTFTTAAGIPTGNPSNAYNQSAYFTGASQPTNMVSWYEAAQFCNYLTSGNKSLGAYQLGTDGSIIIDRTAAVAVYGIIYVIPTEDEWYRAAYHKPDGSGYSLYANGTNTEPIPGTNYNNPTGSPWNVGTGTIEQNGTFDMMGNVFEWNETHVDSFRGVLGGSYENTSLSLSAERRDYGWPYYEGMSGGFRIAEIPEPATLLLLGLGGFLSRRAYACRSR